MSIPIQNIYYLLCYAWNKLDERDILDVPVEDCNKIIDLLAKVLTSAVTHLLKRGLDRDYIEHHEDRSTLRGKVAIYPSLRRNLFVHGRAHCHFDDLHYNILHNQILKTTIRKLILCKALDLDLKDQLVLLYRRLHGIEEINLNLKAFRSVHLHRNNCFYDFTLQICELIYENSLVAEGTGDTIFRDFIQDEGRMRKLFEEFVRNFYRIEQKEFIVGREDICWLAEEVSVGAKAFLPIMRTDISLESKERKIIIDTKFSKDTLQEYFGKKSVKSENLYQLFSYMMNCACKGGVHEHCEGILLYPSVDSTPPLHYRIHGHNVSVLTINLNQDWRGIHRDLLGLLSP